MMSIFIARRGAWRAALGGAGAVFPPALKPEGRVFGCARELGAPVSETVAVETAAAGPAPAPAASSVAGLCGRRAG